MSHVSVPAAEERSESSGEEAEEGEDEGDGDGEGSGDDESEGEELGGRLLPNGLPGHAAVAAGGRVRRRAVFGDGAGAPERAGAGRAKDVGGSSDEEDEQEEEEEYEDLAAQRTGGAAGPSGRGAGTDSGSEDSEGAPRPMYSP